jgi:hypothetical protein
MAAWPKMKTEGTMRKFLVLLGVLGWTTLWAAASTIGLGLGVTEPLGFGGGEVFGEFGAAAAWGWRISFVYLAPVLPAEQPAAGFLAGVKWSLGETWRPFLVASGGAVLEPNPVQGPLPGWVLAGTAGVEWRGTGFGAYFAGSVYFVWRPLSGGTVLYPYPLWTLGILFGS